MIKKKSKVTVGYIVECGCAICLWGSDL